MTFQLSKTKKREFVKRMNEIDQFCAENGITQSASSDSYYFTIGDKNYRVSNHSIYQSNRKAFDAFGNQIRPLYHDPESDKDLINIYAGKTRIIEIYNKLRNEERK